MSFLCKVMKSVISKGLFTQFKMENSSASRKEAVSIPLSWSLLSLVLGIVTFLGNLLTITVFWKRRVSLKRTTYLLINLAVADLMVGVAVIFIMIATLFKTSDLGRVLISFLAVDIPLNASIFSLAVTALERLFAVVRPLRHRTTKTRYYFYAVAVVWLASAFIFLLVVLNVPLDLLGAEVWYAVIGFHSASLVLICISYLVMWRVISKRPQQFQPREQNKKLAKTLFIVTAVSLVTWLPFEVFATIVLIDEDLIHRSLLNFAWSATILNSLLNPLVYALRMPEFRREVKLLFGRRNFHNFEENIPMTNLRGTVSLQSAECLAVVSSIHLQISYPTLDVQRDGCEETRL